MSEPRGLRVGYKASAEQFAPGELAGFAVRAEELGLDSVTISDHFQPWRLEGGHAPNSLAWMSWVLARTERVLVGTSVMTPTFRYNPAVVAQTFATLEEMFPRRAFLGIGSGESLNESPCGMDWPPVREQVDRMEEALEIIGRLFDGERLDHEGRFFRTKMAYLHTRGERRPPIYVSAFGPRSARIAARLADGVWTLADPDKTQPVIDAYKGKCDELGKKPGEIILQAGFSWAEDDDAALEGARVWKGAQPPEYYTDDWHDPAAMYRHAEENVSDDEFREAYIISSDPEEHAERVRGIEKMEPTVVCLQNASGADPEGALRVYGEKVLPALRGVRV
jgi:coenzyme F420-dependent glucose-6-phosphate dehydrogenase